LQVSDQASALGGEAFKAPVVCAQNGSGLGAGGELSLERGDARITVGQRGLSLGSGAGGVVSPLQPALNTRDGLPEGERADRGEPAPGPRPGPVTAQPSPGAEKPGHAGYSFHGSCQCGPSGNDFQLPPHSIGTPSADAARKTKGASWA
jgi:hypothetical protein